MGTRLATGDWDRSRDPYPRVSAGGRAVPSREAGTRTTAVAAVVAPRRGDWGRSSGQFLRAGARAGAAQSRGVRGAEDGVNRMAEDGVAKMAEDGVARKVEDGVDRMAGDGTDRMAEAGVARMAVGVDPGVVKVDRVVDGMDRTCSVKLPRPLVYHRPRTEDEMEIALTRDDKCCGNRTSVAGVFRSDGFLSSIKISTDSISNVYPLIY